VSLLTKKEKDFIPSPAMQKTAARLMAVQNIYSREVLKSDDVILNMDTITDDELIAFYRDTIRNESPADAEELAKKSPRIKIDRKFLKELTEGVIKDIENIDNTIQSISEKVDTNKVGAILLAILRCATYELQNHEKTPTNVILNEYITLGSTFLSKTETGYLNALLDKLGKKAR